MAMFDLTGKRFIKLQVVRFSHVAKHARYWLCLCDCGKETLVPTSYLTAGETKSCGCLRGEKARQHRIASRRFVQPIKKMPEYNSWRTMIRRCYSPSNDNYSRYGGRGIKVCDRWRSSFDNFYADMGNKPSPEHTIERINRDRDYEPTNCKWADREEQNKNKSNNRLIEYNGQVHTVHRWSKLLGLSPTMLYSRLFKDGWSIEKALTSPKQERELIEFNGEKHTLTQWSAITGISRHAIRHRMNGLGWPADRALTEPQMPGVHRE